MEKVNVTCRLEQDAVVFLDQLAAVTERDRSFLIKKAVERFIAAERWQMEEVEAARREAQEGKVLSEADFAANMKTW